jgi:hypothetical protein
MKLRVGNIDINVWLVARVAVVLTGAFGAPEFIPARDSPFGGGSITLLLGLFGFSIFSMLFVLGIQALNSRSAVVWSKPDWRVNPFSLKQPLQFFHMMGFYLIVSGVAAFAVMLLARQSGLEPFIPIAIGGGILLGVRCCILLFRWKFPSPETGLS